MLSLRTLVEELHVEEVIKVSMYECGHKQTRKVNMISIDSIFVSDAFLCYSILPFCYFSQSC